MDLRSGRRGVGTIVDVTAPGAEGTFWSRLERCFGRGVREHGLPQPRFNVPLRHKGRLIVVDAFWDDRMLAGELHGLRFHRTPEQRGRDDERLNMLTLMGVRTLVFGWREVTEQFHLVAAQLRAALGCVA